MNAELFWFAVGLFGFLLPTTMLAWTIGLLAVGQLRNPADQPPEFRLIASRAHYGVNRHASLRTPDSGAIVAALIFWGGANGGLVFVLVNPKFGLVPIAMVVVYGVVQALWLLRIRRAIGRSHTDRT